MYSLKRQSEIAEHCFYFQAWLDQSVKLIVKINQSDSAAERLALQKDLNRIGIQLTTFQPIFYKPMAWESTVNAVCLYGACYFE